MVPGQDHQALVPRSSRLRSRLRGQLVHPMLHRDRVVQSLVDLVLVRRRSWCSHMRRQLSFGCVAGSMFL